MKITNAINRLQKIVAENPDAVLKMHDFNGDEVLFVSQRENEPEVVWLECESDVDLVEEISARYNEVTECLLNGIDVDEFDFYSDLLDQGITIDLVRKYMDDETADVMRTYCEEHGLL